MGKTVVPTTIIGRVAPAHPPRERPQAAVEHGSVARTTRALSKSNGRCLCFRPETGCSPMDVYLLDAAGDTIEKITTHNVELSDDMGFSVDHLFGSNYELPDGTDRICVDVPGE